MDFTADSSTTTLTLAGDIINGISGFAVDNISVSAVPVPPAVWLFSTGLLGLIGIARRKAG